MSESLLAYLYPHIKGSQEDVATLSLAFILSQSEAVRQAFTRLLSQHLRNSLDSRLQYRTQVTGREKERPDIGGYDTNGKEAILCEAKFYAALTANQPGTYLKRLQENGGKGLVFICPAARKAGLWRQLLDLAPDAVVSQEDEYQAAVSSVSMCIVSWIEIIESLSRAASESDLSALENIHQLDDFCRRMDSDAFIPFEPEDLGVDIARKMERYVSVIEATFECFMNHKELKPSTKGARATPQKVGYTRFFNTPDYGFDLRYDRGLWNSNAAQVCSPFWIRFSGRKADSSFFELRDELSRIPDRLKIKVSFGYYLALIAKPYLTLEETANDLCNQILDYLRIINTSRKDR